MSSKYAERMWFYCNRCCISVYIYLPLRLHTNPHSATCASKIWAQIANGTPLAKQAETTLRSPSPLLSSLACRTCPEACLPISARLPPMPKAQLLISNSCTWVSASCKASPFCVNCISSVFMLSCSFPELPMAAWMGNKKTSHWDSESWILVMYLQLRIFGNMPFQRL